MKPKSTYWLPTYRSPWAVIEHDGEKWRFVEVYTTREDARDLAGVRRRAGVKVRVVRAWIPLK